MSNINPVKRQPSLANLTSRLLSKPLELEVEADVEPYEVVSGFRADPSSSWADTVAVISLLGVKITLSKPSQWSNLARSLSARTDLPMSLGHFPQLASNLQGLMSRQESTPETDSSVSSHQLNKLEQSNSASDHLLGAVLARLQGDYERSGKFLARLQGKPEFEVAVRNEQASLSWVSGRREEAIATWETLPDSVVKDFNLGMARMFEGQLPAARPHLERAVAGLPDSSNWKSLAQVYLVLAK